MKQPGYPLTPNVTFVCFDFESTSERRTIHKRIEYAPTGLPYIYNLAMGDVTDEGIIDDTVRSNNEDRDKILATVIQSMLIFLRRYPGRRVLVQGSTESRTRLYRVVIARELAEARRMFDIYGVVFENDRVSDYEPFQTGRQYNAFIISLRHL